MTGLMAERIRLIIDTDEDLRLAVKLAAMKSRKSASELINDILRKALASELRDARKYAQPPENDLKS